MILDKGDKVLVVHGPSPPQEITRFFTGVVYGYDSGVIKVTGNCWTTDTPEEGPFSKEEMRTKLLSISSGKVIVYQIPDEVELTALEFHRGKEGITLTDGAEFTMSLKNVCLCGHKKRR